ncbi:MAG TPA: serine hydrolase domain-containing protein [Bryobacteraceae bacterium]|nr:serine hydrolase domain-containing protein [Bryobacteraceae bacterium]
MRKTSLALTAAFVSSVLGANLAPPPDARAKIDKIFERFNHTNTPGCVAGATIDGGTVLSSAYGMADLEHGIALAPESILEPGSIAKQFTAAAVLLLAQQGKLSLDDPVRKYIPEVPDYGTPITIRHLINHTSGLRDWGSVEGIGGWPRTTREYTHAHVLEIVSRQRALNYPPGAEYSYTNTGFNLAAILVSRVSGKSFPEFTREQIFAPLGMESTQWRDDFRRIVRNRAVAYSPSDNTFRQDMPFEDVFGNGGLLTTVGDLLRWNRNFTDAKVGGRAFVDSQHRQGRLSDGRTIAYAAGLMVLHWKGLNEVSHSGSTAGYQAWLGRYPEQGLSVAVLCNVSSANATELGHQVADVYLAGVVREPPHENVVIEPVTLEAKTGLYRSVRDHQTLLIEVQDGKLRIDHRGVLAPVSGEVFRLGEDGPRAEFDSTGKGLRMSTQVDEGNYYEKVERWNPTPSELEAITGEYASDEAEVSFHVALEKDRLVIHRRPDATIALTPTYRDGFSSSLGSVRFLRDSAGRFTELSIGEQRVWDMRFRRVR